MVAKETGDGSLSPCDTIQGIKSCQKNRPRDTKKLSEEPSP